MSIFSIAHILSYTCLNISYLTDMNIRGQRLEQEEALLARKREKEKERKIGREDERERKKEMRERGKVERKVEREMISIKANYTFKTIRANIL